MLGSSSVYCDRLCASKGGLMHWRSLGTRSSQRSDTHAPTWQAVCILVRALHSGLKELPLLDLLRKLRRCPDRLQLLLRPNCNCLRLDGVGTGAARQKLALQALGELAGLRDTSVIDEATPASRLSNTEVTLRTTEEAAAIIAGFGRRSIVVRRTTHHRNQPQEEKQVRAMSSRFRTTRVC